MRRCLSPTLSAIAAIAVTMSMLPGADEVLSVEQRLQALDQEVKLLKEAAAKNAAAGTGASAAAADGNDAPPKFTANAKDGFSLSSADGAYRLRLGGFAQIDGRYFLNDDVLTFPNTFTLSRVRPSLEGTIAKYFDYRVVFELAQTPSLVDANVTANIDPMFKLTAGRFKVPFGLEMLQSDVNTAFVTRGLPTALSPTRDAGFQASGEVLGGTLSYAIGIFNGPVDGGNKDPDTSDDKDGIARLWATPFKNTGVDVMNTLSLGFAASYGYEEGTGGAAATNLVPTYKTAGNNTFFAYDNTAFANGTRSRYSPQLYWPIASFDLMAEYIVTTQHIQEGAVGADVSNSAWQVEAGYVLTGEKASMKGVTPGKNFGPEGWGAFQLVARYGVIEIDDAAYDNAFAARTTQASSATNIGVGVNWFLNRNVKLQLNYDHTTFEDGATAILGGDRETEEVIQTRVQFVF